MAASTMSAHLRSKEMKSAMSREFTVKRAEFVHNARNTDQVKEARIAFIKAYSEAEREGQILVVIDETHFNSRDFRRQGRSPRGSRCVIARQSTSMRGITAISAVARNFGILHIMFIIGSVKTRSFLHFLLQLQEKERAMNNLRTTWIMDNAPTHKSREAVNFFPVDTKARCLVRRKVVV